MQTNENVNRGLTTHQAVKLLADVGENSLRGKKKTSRLKIFLGQFKDMMVIVLLVSIFLSILMGEAAEALVILAIVILNALLGYSQEYKTEKTLEALKNIAAPGAKVIRDGAQKTISAAEVVPGDLIVLEAGDRIPADGVVIESGALGCDESFITGESLPVEKIPSPNGERGEHNAVYMGATVTKGHGLAVVTHTGMNTEMGSIAGMLDEIEDDPTPLQIRLEELGKYIAVGCLAVCTVVSAAGILRGEDVFDMIVTGISLAVAAVPEGLPAIVTISLAIAVNRILKRNALVRKLHAVETLGAATVICSDKTGTLTENKMTVKEIYTAGGDYALGGGSHDLHGPVSIRGNTLGNLPKTLRSLAEINALCNNASIKTPSGETKFVGEPTELALLIAANKIDSGSLDFGGKKVKEIPFDSSRKMMSVIYDLGGQRKMYVKGAPDVLLERCTSVLTDYGVKPLDDTTRRSILAKNDDMASRALRVIASAYREPTSSADDSERGLVFVGLSGMMDPPRKEAAQAVKTCNSAGIRTVMITGDHKLTASAVAEELGILKPGDIVCTGAELDGMSEQELAGRLPSISVFARVSPAHKLRIVKAFKALGEVVAMTGDGVNDAPAVKEADIGVSMGISGTDVTKEASSIILLDDNFATLVAAVEEGRVIYANIRRFIRYLISCNIGEVLTMFLGMLMGMPTVLLPIQILLVNLVTDGLPAIALGLEGAESDIMTRRPRGKNESVFAGGLMTTMVVRGCLIGICTLAAFTVFYRNYGMLAAARTGALLTLITAQLFHVFECKSETKALWRINIFSNPKLLLATIFSAAIAYAAIYVPPLRALFGTVPLTLGDIGRVLGICIVPPIISGISLELKASGQSRAHTIKKTPVKSGKAG